ncbi:MAG TPA: YHS domain-containing protein [Propionibacteriaceae bacterium]|jgi:YHS domain-containing protein
MTDSERCPVCGMHVDPESSPSESYDGTTYHFCSNDCRTAFQQEPQSYVPGQSM